MKNVYQVQYGSISGEDERATVRARGFMVDSEGNLLLKNTKEGGVVAMFVASNWRNLFVTGQEAEEDD